MGPAWWLGWENGVTRSRGSGMMICWISLGIVFTWFWSGALLGLTREREISLELLSRHAFGRLEGEREREREREREERTGPCEKEIGLSPHNQRYKAEMVCACFTWTSCTELIRFNWAATSGPRYGDWWGKGTEQLNELSSKKSWPKFYHSIFIWLILRLNLDLAPYL